MKTYQITFRIAGVKLKSKVKAKDAESAKQAIRDTLQIIECENLDAKANINFMEFFKDLTK